MHDGNGDVVYAAGGASEGDVRPCDGDAAAMEDAVAAEDVGANACDALHGVDAGALVAAHLTR
ncbi:hypothetical protein [Chitinophaga sp.]|uniref:hypothetical protein n=1 Tax=Chitinophaga sp. TaxID=1869181 RepID=UPI0031D2DB23